MKRVARVIGRTLADRKGMYVGGNYSVTHFFGYQIRHQIDDDHLHFAYSGNIVNPQGVREADVYATRAVGDYWRITDIRNPVGNKPLPELEILIEKNS